MLTTSSRPRGWETNVDLLGVQLAQVLTVLLATACVLLGLLALVAHFCRHVSSQVIPQPVRARRIVPRAIARPSPAELTPLPARDPPPVPPFQTWRRPYRDFDPR